MVNKNIVFSSNESYNLIAGEAKKQNRKIGEYIEYLYRRETRRSEYANQPK